MEVIPFVLSAKLFGVIVFGAIVVFQIGYIFFQWVYIRKDEYLYYAAWMAGSLIYGLEEFEHHLPFQTFTLLDDNFHAHYHHALPAFLIFVYYQFATSFLDLKNTEPVLNRRITRFKYVLLTYCAFEVISNFAGFDQLAAEYIFCAICLFIVVCSILFILPLWRRRNTLIRFTLLGSALLMTGACCTLVLILMEERGAVLPVDPFLPLLIGVIAELLTFTTGLSYKSRLNEKEKVIAQQRLMNERERLANELHDDLGSGITSIRLLSEVAKKKITKGFPQTEIDRISENASGLIDSMNEIIWAMNVKNDSLENLLAYTRAYSAQFLADAGLKHSIFIPESIAAIELKSEVRRNIYLVVKEALHNVVKHAEATETTIEISIDARLEIMISDNGKGLSATTANNFGNGLRNMSDRMEKIGGSFGIENGTEHGTVVKLGYNLQP